MVLNQVMSNLKGSSRMTPEMYVSLGPLGINEPAFEASNH